MVVKKEVHHIKHTPEDFKVEKVLIENFVSLQKVMTNMAVKFDNLSNQISKLLELFEISAKTLAEKDYETKDREEAKKIAEKLDNLLDQNKVIAKGIALLHERNSEPQEKMISVEIPRQQMMRQPERTIETQNFQPRTQPANSVDPRFRTMNA